MGKNVGAMNGHVFNLWFCTATQIFEHFEFIAENLK
jgi:hypothetical protein